MRKDIVFYTLVVLSCFCLSSMLSAQNRYDKEPSEVSTLSLQMSRGTLTRFPAGYFDIDLYDVLGNMLALRVVSSAEQLSDGELKIIVGTSAEGDYVSASIGVSVYDGKTEVFNRSYLRSSTGAYYFLVSGSVVIKRVGDKYNISVSARSAKESELTVSYEGELLPSAYDLEPKTPTEIEVEGTSLLFRRFGYSTIDLFLRSGKHAEMLALNMYSTEVFAQGSFPITNTFKKNTFLASPGEWQPCFYQLGDSLWYLVSGTVSISKDGDDWVIEVDARSYYGSHIRWHYRGSAKMMSQITGLSYENEPSEKSLIVLELSDADVVLKRQNGILALDINNDTTELSLELVTQDSLPKAGVYEVAFDSLPGTLIASIGGTEYADYGTFLAFYDKEGEWLYSYYVVAGRLTVSVDGDDYELLLEGKSSHGSELRVTYKGRLKKNDTGTEDMVMTTTDSTMKRYNLLGVEVGDDYRGVVISGGKKWLVR